MINQEDEIVDARDPNFLFLSNQELSKQLFLTQQKLKETEKKWRVLFWEKNKSYIYIKII